MKRNKDSVRPVLRPMAAQCVAQPAVARRFIGGALFIFGMIALLLERSMGFLQVISQNHGIDSVAIAVAVVTVEGLVFLTVLLHAITPHSFPLQHIFSQRPRYRRTHISHMRLDRFRRLVLRRFTYTTPSIANMSSTTQRTAVGAVPSRLGPVSGRAPLHCSCPTGHYPVLVGGASEGTSASLHTTGPELVPELIEVSDSEDDSEDEDFVPSEWINRGFRWSHAIPNHVRRARNTARNVPPMVLEHILPSPSQAVAAVLTRLPSPIGSPANGQPRYLPEPPNILNDDLNTSEFPAFMENLCLPVLVASASHTFTSRLRTEFDNAWLSGAQSLCFPAAPHYRWPLWVQRLLEMLHVALEKQQKWKRADSWLQTIERSSSVDAEVDLVAACRERLDEIPWDVLVPGFGDAVCLHTTHLAIFLSDDWLNDEMINAGAAHILHELGSESRVRLANCFFLDSLRNMRARSRDQPYLFNSVSSLDCDIRAGRVHVLEVPVNPGGHWTGVKIDLRMKSFAYRDGANPRATVSAELSELLVWYLATVMDSTFNWSILPPIQCPRQEDSFSCGVAYLSTLAAEYLDYDSWSQESHALHRMEWFLRLSERLLDAGSNVLNDSSGIRLDAVELVCAPPLDDPSFSEDHQLSPAQVSSDIMVESSSVSVQSSPSSLPSPFTSESYAHITDRSLTSTTTAASKRRPRRLPRSPSVSSESDSDTSDGGSPPRSCRRLSKTSHPRQDSSWARQREQKAAAQASDFIPNSNRLANFRQKILNDDAHAEFKSSDLCAVRCSSCATWVQMRVLYDVKRWKDHRKSRKCEDRRSKGMITKSLLTFFGPLPPSTSTHSKVICREVVPCTGLTRSANPLVDRYLRRTAVDGGGAPSRQKIAVALFKRAPEASTWSSLTASEKNKVVRREQQLFQWQNKHSLSAVFSTKCMSEAYPSSSHADYAPCEACLSLLSLHVFQNALNVPLPAEVNEKFVPRKYRSNELGDLYLKHKGVRELVETDDGQTPWLRFAKGAVSGQFKSQETALAMIEAMVIKVERLQKGKSLRNMRYAEGLDTFSSYLASISPRAYRTFQRTFAGRSLRSIQQLRAKRPRFEPGISVGNVKRVVDNIKELGYEGPLVFSWDDTDLEKALTVFQAPEDRWLILGAIQGVISVSSVKEIDEALGKARLDMADKLRLFVLSIPQPRIPPHLLAAVARGSKESSDSLKTMHDALTSILHDHGVYPVSYAADGTEVERALQRLIVGSAESYYPYSIPNDSPGCQIDLRVPLFNHRPAVMVQDSKHAGKTTRNQTYSGNRGMSMGNSLFGYKQVRDLSEHAKGPLFKRDVERVDKQDDRAAQRLLSAEALDCLLTYFSPAADGLAIYLFVLGEMYDAWQNRSIPHVVRARMALRARFFLMAWRSHVDAHPHHRLHIHFISRESFDIFLRLCDSLLELIVIHRCFYSQYPLLPWLHSTEVCEHIFGMMRQLKKDFNYSDLLHLEPKLCSLMLGAFEGLSPEEKASQTAAGYHHTYFHAPDLDLAALMQWPTDSELAAASQQALQDVEQLLAVVGVNAQDMIACYHPPLPPKSSRLSDDEPSAPQTLAEVLKLYTDGVFTTKAEEEMEACEMALAAYHADQSLTITSLPEDQEAEDRRIRELIAEFSAQIANAAQAASPMEAISLLSTVAAQSADLLSETQSAATHSFNTANMVSIRAKHQPRSTAKAVRQVNRLKGFSSTPRDDEFAHTNDNNSDAESLPEAILRRLSVLSSSPDSTLSSRSATTGANRQLRHTGIYVLGNTPTSVRAQQKATVLQASASKFVALRTSAFAQLQDIHESMHNANITSLWPLRPGHMVIVLRPDSTNAEPELVLGEVMTMASNSGARGANHDWMPSIDSVGALSYAFVREFSPSFLHTYSTLSCSKLGCVTNLRVPRTHLIFSLATARGSDIRQVDMISDPRHPFQYITLGAFPTNLLRALEQRKNDIASCVRDLIKADSNRQKVTTDGPSSAIPPSNGANGNVSDGEE